MDNNIDIKPNRDKALQLAQREVSVFVFDAVNLEGINFTLPEIQTLLDGITIGGRKLAEQQIALNQGNAWKHLFKSIKDNTFNLSEEYVTHLHSIAGKEEALEWGVFRKGGVTIAGTEYIPPDHTSLHRIYADMVADINNINNMLDRSISIFLSMARNQFFYDVNKRMGRFMMNGILLSNGYPAINLPAKRQLEFNQLMLDFYESGEMGPMNNFMRSCIDKRVIKIMQE